MIEEPPLTSVPIKAKRSPTDMDHLVDKSLKAIRELPGAKLSLRQIFYRLVSWQELPNFEKEYKMLSRLLVQAREDGRVSYDDMEDRSRTTGDIDQEFGEVKEAVEVTVKDLYETVPKIPQSLYQPICHIIAIEKDALKAFFESLIPKESNVILISGKGFNSASQLHEQAEIIAKLQGIKYFVISYFGDFDPSGESIEESFIKRLNKQLAKFGFTIPPQNVKRIVLTRQQVIDWRLPGVAITEKDDPRNGAFEAKYGSGMRAVEMNAIPPAIFAQLIQAQVAKYWDKSLSTEVDHLRKALGRRFQKLLWRRLTKIVTEQPKHEGGQGVQKEQEGSK